MPDRDEQQFGVRPVVPGRSGRDAWVAPAAVAGILLALIAVGRFGGSPAVAVASPVASHAATTRPSPSVAVASATARAVPTPAPTAVPQYFVAEGAGYRLRLSDPVLVYIMESLDPRLVTFAYPRVRLNGNGYGTIRVAVGSRGHGARVRIQSDDAAVYGDTLAELLAAYGNLVPGVRSSVPRPVSGEPGLLLEVITGPEAVVNRSVALVVHGGRAFVLTAEGFDRGTPDATQTARREALEDFLDRFAFDGPALYTSIDLQFEVALVGEPPTESTIAFANERYGTITFPDGTGDTSIRVFVGTSRHPVRLPLARGPTPAQASFWAPEVTELFRRVQGALDTGPALALEVGGEPAIRVERLGAAGTGVLVAHGDLVFFITTTGARGDAMSAFEAFLATFRFLDGPSRP